MSKNGWLAPDGWPVYTVTVEELGHTAEVGLRVTADSAEAVFAGLAQAMFTLTGVEVEDSAESYTRTLVIHAIDRESLLVEWLNQLLYWYEVAGRVFTRFAIRALTPTQLEADIAGYPVRRRPVLDIKAVTYHDLRIDSADGDWIGQVYFDI